MILRLILLSDAGNDCGRIIQVFCFGSAVQLNWKLAVSKKRLLNARGITSITFARIGVVVDERRLLYAGCR